jgi:ribosomal protein S18 acetylase RimI-like enzyme
VATSFGPMRPTTAESLSLYRARPDDAAEYSRVARATFYDSYAALSDPATMATHLHRNFSEAIQRGELEDPANTVIVAREPDGTWAGFVSLRTGSAPSCVTSPAPLKLARIYAVRGWHGRGAGPFLLEAATAHAGSARFASLWLQVWERNNRAQRFYLKHGFVQVGTHPYRFGDEWEDDLVLVRTL